MFARLKEATVRDLAVKSQGERPLRRPGESVEDHLLGAAGSSRTRSFAVADSEPVDHSRFKVYLLRVATLVRRANDQYALGWKQSPRGAADGRRPEESTPWFAEMAAPGSTFEGHWEARHYLDQPEIRRALGWREPISQQQIFESANQNAAEVLSLHKRYAAQAGLELFTRNLEDLEARLAEARASGVCLLSIGWGGGLLGKSAWLDTQNQDYRQILKSLSLYTNALGSGLPFPKTRKIVFLNNQPATLAGWVRLEVAG
jgi:CRISPR-associated protein Csm5